MSLDFKHSISAKSNLLISEEATDKINYFLGKIDFSRKMQELFMVLNFVINFFIIVRRKRGIANKHFIKHDSN